MDEQRVQAYVALIEKLFACPDGEEGAVLQQHGNLVDGGLVQIMGAVVAQLRQSGDGQRADWLESVAGQVGQAILVGGAASPSVGDLPGDLNGILQELRQPVRDVRQMGRRVELCRRALALVPRQGNEQLWAALQGELGNSCAQNPLGDRAENIEEAIRAYEQSLQARTREAMPVDWAQSMNNLAVAYYSRIRGDRAENIEAAIRAYEQSLQVRTREAMPVDWAVSMMNLATAYCSRIRGDRAQNIEDAINAYEQSLQVRTHEAMPVEWATSMMNLANAYSARIRGDRAQNIEVAINAYEQSLQVRTRESMPVEWAESVTNLAAAYADRIRGDRAQNIENAISSYEQFLQVITRKAMPVEWAQSMNNLATVYSKRIRGDRAQNIEDAINFCEQSLQVRTREAMPVEWAQSMNDLATAYCFRICGDRAQNIEDAISAYEQSLQVITRKAMPVEWATSMSNLANAYYSRIRGDRTQNIEDAISTYERSLQVRTHEAMPFEWAQSMNNLATAYCSRIRGDRAQNIENAISAYEQSLQVITCKAMPVEWAQSMNNLATAYSEHIRGDRAQNIEDAINVCEQSLKVRTREAMPIKWAQSMNNLAIAYCSRIRGDRAQNLEVAIDTYEQALQVITREAMPVKWATSMVNLANAYSKYTGGDRTQNIENAISAYSRTLEIFTPDAHPNNCRRSARHLANLYADHDLWSEAQTTYRTALEAAEILYQAAISKGSQESELKETNDLYRRAAYAYAKVDDLETAIATIEQGRARSLSETLQRDRADLEAIRQINPDLADRYQTAANAISLLEATERRTGLGNNQPQYSAEDFRNQATQARQALQDCLTEIRQIPGYESFLALPTFADIAATLQPGQPLIYLIPTPNGSLALMVHLPSPAGRGSVLSLSKGAGGEGLSGASGSAWAPPAEAPPPVNAAEPLTEAPSQRLGARMGASTAAIWLNDFTETDLLTLLTNDTQTGWFDTYQNQTQDRDAWFTTLDRTLYKLWQPVLAPILRHLSQTQSPTATLIPTGLFSLLPLHAAWTRDASSNRRYACDFIQFTYAPNALALPAAREVATPTPTTKLLAINDPQPVTASPLPSSSLETANAIATFPGKGNWKILQHEDASPAAVLEALPNHSVAHFSCHGSANFRQPLNSGLLMANDEILSLRNLLNLKLQGLRLAVLSACETGIPGTDLPDEVISLPTGLLQAGAAGVVSSLWSVADLSTMVLLSRFYHLWRTDGLEPPEALRQAQLWLRDSTGPELAPYLQQSHPDLAVKFAQAPNQRPFAHPFHWAAFTYTGV